MEKRNVNEDLKGKNQMRWLQEMNNIRNTTEEIVVKKMIEVG